MFSTVARQYLEWGLCVIPCGKKKPKVPGHEPKLGAKEPLVNWRQFQDSAPSARVIERWIATGFKNNLAPVVNIGAVTGKVSGLTVVDVDSADHIANAIALFGDTPLKAATPRGGLHLYYKFAGERCATKINGTPIDIRGQGGFIVLPPSVNPDNGKAYSVTSGDYSMLRQLPAANPVHIQRPASGLKKPLPELAWGEVAEEGQRNDALFAHLRLKAFDCATMEELMDIATATNNLMFTAPLPDAEVQATLKSVWGMKCKGNLKRPGQQYAALDAAEIEGLTDKPRALVLLAHLKKNHDGMNPKFKAIDIALADILRWSVDTVEAARHVLLERGYLILVHQGGNGAGDPSLYRFP